MSEPQLNKDPVYTVTEDAVNGYTAAYNGLTITNTHTPETIDITGTKAWADDNNRDGIRPSSITITLMANGVEKEETTATSENNWAYSFLNLPKYASGTPISYSIKESSPTEYTPSIEKTVRPLPVLASVTPFEYCGIYLSIDSSRSNVIPN